MGIHLIGGGWSPEHADAVYGGFLSECAARVGFGVPVVTVVAVHDGPRSQGQAYLARFTTVLRELRDCTVDAVLLAPGDPLPESWRESAGVLVCGGTTPAYASALAPAAAAIVAAVAGGLPYAGFSAGAAVAARRAVVGGWRLDDVAVAGDEVGEGLDPVTVTAGLGLVPRAVDVHAAQWGTVTRLVALVQRGFVPAGVALDEDTVLVVRGSHGQVYGAGAAWDVVADGAGCRVTRRSAGSTLDL